RGGKPLKQTSNQLGTDGVEAASGRTLPRPVGHTRSAGGAGHSEAAMRGRRSGRRVLVSSSPATGKNTHRTAEDELCGPGARGSKKADAVSLLKSPSSAHRHSQT
ncbi:Hypothetical predicted protein, partial [Pelobates cultripes]